MNGDLATSWIILLRGVNVGGHNPLPMADFRAELTRAGLQDVESYIQSGNLIARHPRDPAELVAAALAKRGITHPVWTSDAAAFRRIVARCPVSDAEGKTIHALLCFDAPTIDAAARDRWAIPGETLHLVDRTIWLHAPDGIGRSKLMANIGRVIGTAFTARNLNTLQRLIGMLDRRGAD